MSTTHHTAITTGAAANAATVNSPLGELDAAIVAADLTEGGDIDGTLGISESTIPTGAMLAVGGGIAVTNGAGVAKTNTDYISVESIGSSATTLRSVTSDLELWMIELVGVNAASNVHGVLLVAGSVTVPVVYKVAGSSLLVLSASPTGYQIGISVSGTNIQATLGASWGAGVTTTAKATIIRHTWV